MVGAAARHGPDTAPTGGRHGEQRLPPFLQRRDEIGRRRVPRRLQIIEPWPPVSSILVEVRTLVVEDRQDVGFGERMGDLDRVGPDLDRRSRDVQQAGPSHRREPLQERPLIREDAHLVAVDQVQAEQFVVEEARWAHARHDRTGVDVLDVAHRPRTGRRPWRRTARARACRTSRRPSDTKWRRRTGASAGRPGRAPGVCEIVGAAVVLVDEDRVAVDDDEGGVTPRAVGDRRLDVDRNANARGDLEFLGVDRAHELAEPEFAERSTLLAGRIVRQQDRNVAPQMRREPGRVVVVTVQVRHVQEVGLLDALEQIVRQLVVAREREPRSEECRHEPRVAQDRDVARLDQYSGVADRGRTHGGRGVGVRQPAGR